MNLGAPEILVILVVALIVFGPKKLPEVGRQVGSAMRELRRMQDSVRAEMSSVFDDGPPRHVTTPSVHEIEVADDHDVGPGAAPSNDDMDNGPSGSFS